MQFNFPSPWRVLKYDEHRFFQGFSGRGLKGVDFLVLHPGEELVLLEVKNLDQYAALPHWPERLEELAGAVGQKVEDTLQGIDAIDRYYQRRWWHRCLLPLTRWKKPPASWEWIFWKQAAELAGRPEKVSVIFLLESNTLLPQWRTDLEHQLREDLHLLSNNILIANQQDLGKEKKWIIGSGG